MFGKKIFSLIALITIAAVISLALVYVFAFVTEGSGFIAKLVLSRFTKSKEVNFQEASGSLSQILSLKDVKLENIDGLPQGSIIEIQKLEVYFTALNLKGLNAEIFNGRLITPDSETLLFSGECRDASLDIDIYSKKIDVKELLRLFVAGRRLKRIAGSISNLEINLKGDLFDPQLIGKLQINKFTHKDFSLAECPISFDIILKDIREGLKLHGKLVVNGGSVSGQDTALINLKQSKVLFLGDSKIGLLDIKGSSIVEGVKINITVEGSTEAPDIKLTSEPPMSQERLLIMLATGKSWKSVAAAISKGEISPDLAMDFIDYFVFGGMGSKIAKQLGISELSFKYDSDAKGIQIKKVLTDRIEASYALEQSQQKENKTTSNKFGGEYKVTENIFIGGEKEVKITGPIDNVDSELSADDSAYIKYKKQF